MMGYIEACNVLGVSEDEAFENISAQYYMLISKYASKNIADLFYNEEASLLIIAYYSIKKFYSMDKRRIKSR